PSPSSRRPARGKSESSSRGRFCPIFASNSPLPWLVQGNQCRGSHNLRTEGVDGLLCALPRILALGDPTCRCNLGIRVWPGFGPRSDEGEGTYTERRGCRS